MKLRKRILDWAWGWIEGCSHDWTPWFEMVNGVTKRRWCKKCRQQGFMAMKPSKEA